MSGLVTALTTFVRARIEEDETVARQATPGPWHQRWEGQELQVYAPGQAYPYSVATWTYLIHTGPRAEEERATCNTSNSDHITRHHPLRVLREAQMKRAILAAHPITDHVIPPGYGPGGEPFGCKVCHDWDGATEGRGYCVTLRLLAGMYVDHPDYEEAWRP
ncbi:DUF6221 family protein [Embleya scabrispora]|nr:DUF6221 family protein [Embleya scabrispora]